MSLKVITAEEALATIKANPGKVLVVKEKPGEKKTYKGGAKFLDAHYHIGSTVNKDGWFSFKDVQLTDGIADPANKADSRTEFEPMRLQLQSTVKNAGDFGEFLNLLNKDWTACVDKLAESGVISLKGKQIHGIVQDKYSDQHKTNPGGDIEDPIVRFKVDFGLYPATYPHKWLQGKPKTTFFDYNTRYIDENKREQFKPAKVKDPKTGLEVPVTAENVHLFATKGSWIRCGRVNISSVADTKSWISMPIAINKVVIEQGEPEGFSDEVVVDVREALAATVPATVPAPIAPGEQPKAQLKPADDVDLEQLDNLLEGI